MSVRFLVLFPSDPLEAVFALQLLNRLNKSFDGGWTGLLIPEQNEWISHCPIKVDEILLFRKTPGEHRRQIRDFLPDYLIDLSGEPRFWLFKNRTQLVHFTLSPRFLRSNLEISDLDKRYTAFSKEMDRLLDVFELSEVDWMTWDNSEREELVNRVLPESYCEGYGTVNLETIRNLMQDQAEGLIDFFSQLDTPIVLLGKAEDRISGDLLTTKVGCSVFNACGDLSQGEEQAILASSKAFLGGGKGILAWSFLQKRISVDLGELFNEKGDVESCVENIRKQIRNT